MEALEPGQVLDVREAASLLGYHEETLRRMTREGRVPAFRIGRKWHYDRKVLAKWMAECHEEQHEQHAPSAKNDPIRILVVDDDLEIRRVYERILETAGYTVTCIADGASAIATLAEDLPDLLIVDLVMPGVDGVAVLAALRTRDTKLPVIVSTGYPRSDMMARAMHHGPLTLLAKPVPREKLEQTVKMLVGPRD